MDSSPVLDSSKIPTAPVHQWITQASILGPHAATSQHKWKKSTHVEAIYQLQDKNNVQQIPSQSIDSTPHYPSINDPMYYPLLSAYTHRNIPQLALSSQDSTSTFLNPVVKTNKNTVGFFNQFLSSWAHNNNNHNLFGPPPPFHINPFPSPSHSSFQ